MNDDNVRRLDESRRAGLAFEERVAALLGLEGVPGSGNKWYQRLDLRGRRVRVSCKWTRTKAMPIDTSVIDEAVEVTDGPGGFGGDVTPLWITEMQDNPEYDLVTMRLSDFIAWSKGDIEIVTVPSTKAEQRAAKAAVPELFREGA